MLSPVRLSVRLSHGWISQKRLKLESCNFHHTVASSLSFVQDKFHPEIRRESPERRRQTRVGNLTVAASLKYNTWRRQTLDGAVIVRHGDCTHFFTNSAEFTWSAKLLHYFAINDIHAEIYSAVVYFSHSVLNQIFLRLHGHRFKTRKISYRPTK